MSNPKQLDEVAVASCLRETGYSIEVNGQSRPRVERLLDRSRRIENRYEGICATLGPVFATMTKEQRAYQTHHSVRLELQGPKELRETQAIVDQLPTDVQALAHAMTERAVRSDEHLVHVVGAYGAELLAEQIARSFADDRGFSEADLRELNRFVIRNKHFAGQYRQDDYLSLGQSFDDDDPLWFSRDASRKVEVSWIEIPDEMRRLCAYISAPSDCPPLAAAVAHAWFTRVHPFRDGNGRVARLIANLVLLRNGWPPVVIRHTDREDYLDSLEESDEGGGIQRFFELMVKWIDLNLDEYSHPEIFGRNYQAELSSRPSARLDAWTRAAWELIGALRRELHARDIYVERVSMPASSTFTLLELGEGRAATLLAKIHPQRGRDVRVGLGYMSRAMRDGASIASQPTGLDGDHDAPTVYFQERNTSPDAEFPYVERWSTKVFPQEITFPFADPSVCLVRLDSINVLSMPVEEVAARLADSLTEVCETG